MKEEVQWGLGLDSTKINSLVNWFAGSNFNITDLWVPATGPVCSMPIETENIVYVKLSQPDSLIDTLGFKQSPPPGYCFPAWTDYKYTEVVVP
jgi:hypothetical protein